MRSRPPSVTADGGAGDGGAAATGGDAGVAAGSTAGTGALRNSLDLLLQYLQRAGQTGIASYRAVAATAASSSARSR